MNNAEGIIIIALRHSQVNEYKLWSCNKYIYTYIYVVGNRGLSQKKNNIPEVFLTKKAKKKNIFMFILCV